MELACKLHREDFASLGPADSRRPDTEFLNLRAEGLCEGCPREASCEQPARISLQMPLGCRTQPRPARLLGGLSRNAAASSGSQRGETWRRSVVTSWVGLGVALISGGWGPEMLLNSLHAQDSPHKEELSELSVPTCQPCQGCETLPRSQTAWLRSPAPPRASRLPAICLSFLSFKMGTVPICTHRVVVKNK